MLAEICDMILSYLPMQDTKVLYVISRDERFLSVLYDILSNPIKYKSHYEYDREIANSYEFVKEYACLITTDIYYELVRFEVELRKRNEQLIHSWEHAFPFITIAYEKKGNTNFCIYLFWKGMIGSKYQMDLTKCLILLDLYYKCDIMNIIKYAPFISRAGHSYLGEQTVVEMKSRPFSEYDGDVCKSDECMVEGATGNSELDVYCNDFMQMIKWRYGERNNILLLQVNSSRTRQKYNPSYSTYYAYLVNTFRHKEEVEEDYNAYLLEPLSYTVDGAELVAEDMARAAILNGNVNLANQVITEHERELVILKKLLGSRFDECVSSGLHIHMNYENMAKFLIEDPTIENGVDPKYLAISSEFAKIIMNDIDSLVDLDAEYDNYYELCPACVSDIGMMENIIARMKVLLPNFVPKLAVRNTAVNLVEHYGISRIDIMMYTIDAIQTENDAKEFVKVFMDGRSIGKFRHEYLEIIYKNERLKGYIY